jgi:hypothetical protein
MDESVVNQGIAKQPLGKSHSVINVDMITDIPTKYPDDFNTLENETHKLTPYNNYKQMYDTYLQAHNLPLYKENTGFGQALAYLNTNLGKELPIEKIKEYVNKQGIPLNGGDSLQLRHVARCYNLLKGGEMNPITNKKVKRSQFCLINLTTHHPNYIPSRNTNITMTENEWVDLKKNYNNQCATCGNIEGEPMRFNSYSKTKLQRGHMDPIKEGRTDNIIPQCKDCNQQYKNKAIFNKHGRVIDWCKSGFI